MRPDVDVTVCTTIPESRIRRELTHPVRYRRQDYEPGTAQKNCFEVDTAATRDLYRSFLRERTDRIREEEAFLRGFDGVVGDIPVRVGDRVTPSTVLTTIDRNRGLELYVNVPVREASRLEVGLPVHLVDEAGQVFATEKLSFVSPSVNGATQSVLAKANLETTEGLRTEQFVRARVVWSQEPTLTVPIVALNRVGGQYFAFVAEDGDGGTVARQRTVDLGKVVGNDYLLKSGLAAGERLIVSGVQRVRDGAPVSIVTGPEPAARAEDR